MAFTLQLHKDAHTWLDGGPLITKVGMEMATIGTGSYLGCPCCLWIHMGIEALNKLTFILGPELGWKRGMIWAPQTDRQPFTDTNLT